MQNERITAEFASLNSDAFVRGDGWVEIRFAVNVFRGGVFERVSFYIFDFRGFALTQNTRVKFNLPAPMLTKIKAALLQKIELGEIRFMTVPPFRHFDIDRVMDVLTGAA